MGMVGNCYLQKAERLGKGIPANCGESSAGETSRLHRCQRGVGAGEWAAVKRQGLRHHREQRQSGELVLQRSLSILVTLNTNRVSDPSASLKLFLGAQPTKSPELNANNKVPPALVLNLKLEPVRPPSSQPGGTGSYAGAAPGDSLARAAVLFKVAKPITGTWALQDPGTYAIRSIEQVRPG